MELAGVNTRPRKGGKGMTKKELLEMLAKYPDDMIIKILNPEKQEFVPVKDSCQVGNALLLLYDDEPNK